MTAGTMCNVGRSSCIIHFPIAGLSPVPKHGCCCNPNQTATQTTAACTHAGHSMCRSMHGLAPVRGATRPRCSSHTCCWYSVAISGAATTACQAFSVNSACVMRLPLPLPPVARAAKLRRAELWAQHSQNSNTHARQVQCAFYKGRANLSERS